jgi:hypothetical protein
VADKGLFECGVREGLEASLKMILFLGLKRSAYA